METKNALIKSTYLGIEDHGIMTFYLNLDYGDCFQSAGGYALDTVLEGKDGKFVCRIGYGKGMSLIMEILKTVEVEKWEDLPCHHIRVLADHTKVSSIGHLLKDKWLNFEQFLVEDEDE
jgi:hypothetical protein